MLILVLVLCLIVQPHHQSQSRFSHTRFLAPEPMITDVEPQQQQWQHRQNSCAETPAVAASRPKQAAPMEQQQQQQLKAVVPDMQALEGVVFPEVAQQVIQQELAGQGRKIIAVSLYGNSSKYTQGAIENAMLARRDWPGWVYQVYNGSGVPEDVLRIIEGLGGELVDMSGIGVSQGRVSSTMWRFWALLDRTATRTILRDADARITLRDKAAVEEWMQSKKPFHVMHDHPAHIWPVLAGMFGAVNGFLHPNMIRALIAPNQTAGELPKLKWLADQQWLKYKVWPHVKQHTIAHASWHCRRYGAASVRGFPTKRLSVHDFVGNRFEQQNDWRGEAVTKSGNFTCPAECRRNPDWQQC